MSWLDPIANSHKNTAEHIHRQADYFAVLSAAEALRYIEENHGSLEDYIASIGRALDAVEEQRFAMTRLRDKLARHKNNSVKG